MPADHSLIDQLRHTIRQRRLIPPGTRVLVAVSGGPDSLALLHALCSLRDELRVELVVAHLNHGMRGDDAEADVRFVQETAAARGMSLQVEARDVPAFARRAGLSLEEAGREARYRFFRRAARRAGCQMVATAHTADDRAENVLMHLFRGTGLDGLAGLPVSRPLCPGRATPTVIRPLIDVSRAQVLAYCAANSLQPRHDSTNDSPDPLRNRLRHELIPQLEAGYAPTLRRHLARLARLAEEETGFLDELASALLEQALTPSPEGTGEVRGARGPLWDGTRGQDSLRMDRAVLLAAPPVLARRALRLAAQAVQPDISLDQSATERLLSLTRDECPGFTLRGGRLRAVATGRELIFEPIVVDPTFPTAEPVTLELPGATHLPRGGTITAWLVPDPSASAAGPTCPWDLLPLPPEEALLDQARLAGPLTARLPLRGDRIQPLGMTGRRKLQDLFTDRKLPRRARRRVPVVCDGERIVWVAGCCLSDTVRITPQTERAVHLRWDP